MGIIPMKKSLREENFSRYTCLLHGDPKVGKSTFCSEIPGALFIDTENGLQALEVFKIPIGKWEDYKTFLKELEETKPKHVKTVIIDTVDELWKMATAKVCEIKGVSHVSDLGWGKGYSMVKTTVSLSFAKIKALGYGLILVSHTETKSEKVCGVPHDVKASSLPNSARREILPLVDFIFYVGTKEIPQKDDDNNPIESKWERVLYTKPSRQIEAGDRTGLLPSQLPLDYQNLAQVFKKCWEEQNGKPKEV